MRHKLIFVPLVMLLACASAHAAEYDGLYAAGTSDLKAFAGDLGGLLGSGSNQTARSLGFSGFDLGVRGAMQLKPSLKNSAVKKNRAFGLGLVQAEIGMPYRVDGFVRGGLYEGVAVAGGGVRYGLWNVSDEKYKINAMLVVMGNIAAHKYFYAAHFNTSLVGSMNVPVLAPYVGVGFDSTRLEVQSVNDVALNGKEVSVFEPRYMAGLRARIKLAYLSVGAVYTHDRMLYSAGLGVRF